MTSLSQRRLSCVKCQVFQPAAGKLLSCLHVVCAGCAAEESDPESNCVRCGDCGKLTKALLNGVPICSQLANCQPHLYRVAEGSVGGSAKFPGSVGNSGESKAYCEWCDDEAMVEATHECERCGGALFCQKHAERHQRARSFAGHIVQELSRAGDPADVSKPHTACCMIHNSCVPVSFCQVCSHAVCAECLASGHEGHTFTTLKSQAARERSSLREAMQSSIPEYSAVATTTQPSSDSSSTVITTPFETLISGVSMEMEKIHEEAKKASSEVTEAFGRLEAKMKEQQQQALRCIENMAWKQLEAQENRQQRLHHLQEKHATVMDLTRNLTSSAAEDADVIQLAEAVKQNLGNVPSDLLALQVPPYRDPVAVVPVDDSGLLDIERSIKTLIKIHDVVDLTKSTLSVPTVFYASSGKHFVQISLPMPSFNPTPNLHVHITPPSGQLSSVSASRRPLCSPAEVVMFATIRPTEVGYHELQIRHASGKVKSAAFDCQPTLSLDPKKCSSSIKLSANNRLATHTGRAEKYATVVAHSGFTMGSHSWNVKFVRVEADRYGVHAGVTVLPHDNNYKCEDYRFFSVSRCYSVNARGSPSRSQTGSISQFNNGDTASFTLDCDKCTLEVDHHRTNERTVVTGLCCDQPLYPAISLSTQQSQVEFY